MVLRYNFLKHSVVFVELWAKTFMVMAKNFGFWHTLKMSSKLTHIVLMTVCRNDRQTDKCDNIVPLGSPHGNNLVIKNKNTFEFKLLNVLKIWIEYKRYFLNAVIWIGVKAFAVRNPLAKSLLITSLIAKSIIYTSNRVAKYPLQALT